MEVRTEVMVVLQQPSISLAAGPQLRTRDARPGSSTTAPLQGAPAPPPVSEGRPVQACCLLTPLLATEGQRWGAPKQCPAGTRPCREVPALPLLQ